MEPWNFEECETCAAKSGTPPLCSGCLNNRTLIESLNREIAYLTVELMQTDFQ